MQICTTAGGSESLKIAQPTFTPQSSQHGVFQYNPTMVLLKTHKQKAGGAARPFPMQLREPAAGIGLQFKVWSPRSVSQHDALKNFSISRPSLRRGFA